MGQGQKILTWGGSAIFGLGLGWKISLKNPKNFNFRPLGQIKSLWVGSKSTLVKAGSASYLMGAKSMLGSGPFSKVD